MNKDIENRLKLLEQTQQTLLLQSGNNSEKILDLFKDLKKLALIVQNKLKEK